jgi:hypothetical protein
MNDFPSEIYNRTLISYIDILGFADLIKASRGEKSKIAKIANLLTTMRKRSAEGGRIHRRPDGEKETIFHSFNFSDLTVRTTRVPNNSNVADYVDWELFYLAETQLSLATDGFLIRGGICIDDAFVEPLGAVVFGPGLVKAYKLESQYAVFPRIAIDRDLIAEADTRGYKAYWEDYIRQGEDGAYFLDYLFGCSVTGFTVSDAPDPKPRIEAHRKMIQEALENTFQDKDERVKQKYMWLGLYHNSTVKGLGSRFETRLSGKSAEFLVPEKLLRS